MYLKVYYRNGKITTKADTDDIQHHIDAVGIQNAEIHFALGHAAVEMPAGSTYPQVRKLASALQAAGYETE